jgi:hypothetical protein
MNAEEVFTQLQLNWCESPVAQMSVYSAGRRDVTLRDSVPTGIGLCLEWQK